MADELYVRMYSRSFMLEIGTGRTRYLLGNETLELSGNGRIMIV